MKTIPLELVSLIANKLSRTDQLSLCNTCQKFRLLLIEDKRWEKYISPLFIDYAKLLPVPLMISSLRLDKMRYNDNLNMFSMTTDNIKHKYVYKIDNDKFRKAYDMNLLHINCVKCDRKRWVMIKQGDMPILDCRTIYIIKIEGNKIYFNGNTYGFYFRPTNRKCTLHELVVVPNNSILTRCLQSIIVTNFSCNEYVLSYTIGFQS
jgi:hypothetical protein